MLFQAAITIPANTTEADPTVEIMPIAHGIITKIMVRPRPGHAGLAHCVIRYHEGLIAPSIEGMSFSGDAFPIDWEEHLEVNQRPLQLKIIGWNDDDSYPHTFDVYVAILPRAAVLALAIVDAFKGILGALSPKRIFTGR